MGNNKKSSMRQAIEEEERKKQEKQNVSTSSQNTAAKNASSSGSNKAAGSPKSYTGMTPQLYTNLRNKGYTHEQIQNAYNKKPRLSMNQFNQLKEQGYTSKQIQNGEYDREFLIPWQTEKTANKSFSTWLKDIEDFDSWTSKSASDLSKWNMSESSSWANKLKNDAQSVRKYMYQLEQSGKSQDTPEYSAYNEYYKYFMRTLSSLNKNNESFTNYRDQYMYNAGDGNYYSYDQVMDMERQLRDEAETAKNTPKKFVNTAMGAFIDPESIALEQAGKDKEKQANKYRTWLDQENASREQSEWLTANLGLGQDSEQVYQSYADKLAAAEAKKTELENSRPDYYKYAITDDLGNVIGYDEEAYKKVSQPWKDEYDTFLQEEYLPAQQDLQRAESIRDYSVIQNANKNSPEVKAVIEQGKAISAGLTAADEEAFQDAVQKPIYGTGEYGVYGQIYDLNKAEASKRKHIDTSTWSEEKANTYYYLLGSGQDASAERFAKLTNDAIAQAKIASEIYAPLDTFQETRPGWGGVAATAAGIAIPLTTGLGEYFAAVNEYLATGEIDPNRFRPSMVSERMVGNTAGQLNEWSGTLDDDLAVVGGKGAGDLYQVALSAAQSYMSIAMSGGMEAVTLTQFFGSAASSTIYESLDKGMDPGKALALGTLSGIAEVAGEKFSVENLIKIGDAKTARALLKDMLIQAGIEGSEEAFTTILNTMADFMVNGDKNDLQLAVNSYISQGMSPEAAEKQAIKDWLNGMGQDALGGFISGGLGAGGQTIRANIGRYQGNVSYLNDLSSQTAEGSRSRQMAEDISGRNKVSKYAGNQFAAQVQEDLVSNNTDTAVRAIEQRLTELGETGDVHAKAQTMAEAIISDMSGEEAGGFGMTPSSQFASRATANMAQVMDELTKASEQYVDYGRPNESWTDPIMKGRFLDQRVLERNGAATADYAYGRAAEKNLNMHTSQIADLQQSITDAKKELGRLSPTDNNSAARRAELNSQIREAEKAIKSHQDAILKDGYNSYSENEKAASVKIDGTEYTVSGLTAAEGDTKAKLTDAAGNSITVGIDDERLPKAFRSLALKARTLGWASSMAFEHYKPGTDISSYIGRIQNILAFASEKISHEAFMNTSAVKALNDQALAEFLYGKGQELYNERQTKVKETTEKLNKLSQKALEKAGNELAKTKGKGKVDTTSGWTGPDGTHYDGIKGKKLSDKQNAVVRMIDYLSNALNLDYVIFDGDAKGIQGVYAGNGVVGININAGLANFAPRVLAAEALSHEITHFTEEFAPEEYEDLRAAIISAAYNNDPELFEERVNYKMQQLGDNIKDKHDAAVREVVADACTTMLRDSKMVTELARQNMTLAQKMADFIEQTISKIKQAITDAFADSDPALTRREVDLIKNDMDKIQKLWDNALEAAVFRYNATQTMNEKTTREGGDQFMPWDRKDINRAFIDYNNKDSRRRAQVSKLQSLVSRGKTVSISRETIDTIKAEHDWSTAKSAREALKTILRNELGSNSVYFSFDGGTLTAYLTAEGRDHSAGGDVSSSRGAIYSEIKQLIENSEYIYSSKHDIHSISGLKNPANTEWDSFMAVADTEDIHIPVIFSIKTNDLDVRSKLYSIFADEKSAVSPGAGQQKSVGLPNNGESTLNDNISDTSAKSNTLDKKQMAEVAQDVSEGKAIDPVSEVQYSLYQDDEFMRKAEEYNQKEGNRHVSLKDMKRAREVRKKVQQILSDPQLADKLKLPEDNVGNTFLSNSSYGGSEENTTICVRSLAAQALMDYIAKDMGKPLTIEDTLVISQEMMTWINKPECIYCYVATDRRAYRQFLGDYLKQRDAALKSLQDSTDKATAYKDFLAGRKNTKEMRSRFKMWQDYAASGELIQPTDLASIEELFTEIDNLSSIENRTEAQEAKLQQLKDAAKYAQSASWAKKMMGYTAYDGHILKWKQDRIDEFNKHYGLRMYSFSDYSPAFVLENMQMVTDAAVKGLKMLAYTKEIDFAKVFAPSGMNINVSVFASQDPNNGSIMEDEMMGAKWQEAIALRKQYPNVGITLVATNDALVDWGLNNPNVDVVIPYHLVRTGQDVADYFNYKNYTSVSADGKIKGVKYGKGQQKSVYPSEHQNDLIKYVDRLQELQLTPRFESYLKGYEQYTDGVITADQFREMNPTYMKLVNETRQSAQDTPTVKPLFDEQAAMASIDTLIKEGGYNKSLWEHLSNNPDMAESILEEITDTVKEERAKRETRRGEQYQQAEEWDEGPIYNHRALVSDQTLDRWMDAYAATNPNYAQAYITYMNPDDFLKMTTSDVLGRMRIEEQSEGFTPEQVVKASKGQPIFLDINTETGKVTGHEGRHRMVALRRQGITEVPVLLFDFSTKYSKTPLNELTLTGQDFGDRTNRATAIVNDLLPLSTGNKAAIADKYSKKTNIERIREEYSGRKTLQFQMAEDAKERFGTTDDFAEAGYVLRDGSMLRFSDDKHAGTRDYDHRAIGLIYGADIDLTKNHGFDAEAGKYLEQFVEDGNIRFEAGEPDLNMDAGIQLSSSVPLTREQEQTIRDFIEWKEQREASYEPDEYSLYNGSLALHIDFGGDADIASFAKPSSANGLSYYGNINPDRVIQDIRNYYRTGEIRQPSVVTQFHSQYQMASDEEYMNAVNRGNTEDIQRMVDDAAKAAGYNVRAYHGSPHTDISVFDINRAGENTGVYGDRAIWFTDSESFADEMSYQQLEGSSAFRVRRGSKGKVYDTYLRINNPFVVQKMKPAMRELLWEMNLSKLRSMGLDPSQSSMGDREFFFDSIDTALEAGNDQYVKFYVDYSMLQEAGYDGIVARLFSNGKKEYSVEYGVFSAEQIKSADPVTYDQNGNVVPLSQRFNAERPEIQYQMFDNSAQDSLFEAEERQKAWNDLQAENAVLEETVTQLQKEIEKLSKKAGQLNKTDKPEIRLNDAKKMARQILKDTRPEPITTRDKASFREQANKLAESIKEIGDLILETGKNPNEMDYTEIRGMAEGIAKDIVNNAQVEIDDGGATKDMRDQMRAALKKRPIFVPEQYRSDTLDWNDFKKRYKDVFTFKDTGTDIDIVYKSLLEEIPGLLDPNINNPGDMLNELAEKWDLMQPKYENPFEDYQNEAINHYTNMVLQSVLDGTLREIAPTYADRMNSRIEQIRNEGKEKVKAARAEGAAALEELRIQKNARIEEIRQQGIARKQEALAKERADKWERVEATRQYYQEMAARASIKRKNKETKTKINKLINDLHTRLVHPTEKKYVPAALVENTIRILEMIDLDSGKGGVKLQERIALMQQQYAALKSDTTFAGYAYDPIMEEAITNMARVVGNTPLRSMTSEQLNTVLNTLKMLEHTVRTAVKDTLFGQEWNFYEAARAAVKATKENAGTKNNALGNAEDWYTANTMRPGVVFERFGGFAKDSEWEQIYDMLDKAQRYGMDLQMRFAMTFDELLKDKKQVAKLTSTKKEDLLDIGLKDENGDAILVTKDFALFVYMNLFNEDNIQHVMRGGIECPELKEYISGKGDRGYGKGSRRAVGISQRLSDINHAIEASEDPNEKAALLQEKEDVLKEGMEYISNLRMNIEEKMTEYDRKWVQAWWKFNAMASEVLNETSMQVYGFKKFNVEQYFPIITDKNFLNTPMETIIKDMSLENAGFTKERIHASTPIKMMGLSDVINMQANRTAQYASIMPAVRAFNKIYNKTMPGYSTSVKDTLNKKFGDSATKFVENLMADLQGGRHSDFTIFDKLRGRMAQATLSLNPRVALAQTSSFPTAAAELGWKPVLKALARGGKNNKMISAADRELIAKYSSMLWYRSRGYNNVELGDVKNMQQAQHKVMDKLGWAMNWINFMDSATVGRLWYAAQYYVDDHFKALQKGSDAYYEKVAEMFNRTIENTQPNYTTLQRPELLRNPNAIFRQLSMFMTQRLQNQSIMYEAAAKYLKYRADYQAGRNGVTQADVREMRLRAVNAATSQIAAAATITVFKFLTDMLLHRTNAYRRKEDKELTPESISLAMLNNFSESLISNVWLGSELYSAVKSAITKETYYGMELSGVSTMFETVENAVKFAQKPSWNLAKKLGDSLAQYLGIPEENAVKIGEAIWYHIQDMLNGEFGSFEAGVKRSDSQNAKLLTEAMLSGDERKIEKYSATYEDEDDKNNALRNSIKSQYVPEKGKAQKIGKQDAIKLLVESGMYQKDAEKKVQEWTCELVTGIPFNKIKDEYMAGNITEARVVELLQKYGGRDAESAKKTGRSYACEKNTGYSLNELKEAYLNDKIDKKTLSQALRTYGGMNIMKADNKVIPHYDYLKLKPDSEISESKAIAYMTTLKKEGFTPDQWEDALDKVTKMSKGDSFNTDDVGLYITGKNYSDKKAQALWDALIPKSKITYDEWSVKYGADNAGTGKGAGNGDVSQAELGPFLIKKVDSREMTAQEAEHYWKTFQPDTKLTFDQYVVKYKADKAGKGKSANNGYVSQAELGPYLVKQLNAGKMTMDQANGYWKVFFSKSSTTFKRWLKKNHYKIG